MSRRGRRVPTSRQEARLQAQQAAAHRRAVKQLEKRRHANEKFPAVDPPGPGMVRLVADEPPSFVTVLLAESIDIDGGVGGWNEIERDRRTPATVHHGVPRATCTVHGFIEKVELGIDDVDLRIRKLYAMGRVDATTGEPARIRLLGDVPAYNPLWVMDSLKPLVQDRDFDGSARLVEVTIGLSQWVDPSLAVTLPPAATRSTKGKTRARFYTTHKGDTLRRIALQQLGSQAQWKTLLDDNRKALKGADPDMLLKPGTRLRLAANTGVKR